MKTIDHIDSPLQRGTPRRQQRRSGVLRRAAVLAGLLFAAAGAQALPTVTYLATDIADVVVGQDRWRYDYVISGPLGIFETVEMLFAPTLYGPLGPATADPSLTPLTTDPDPFLPADGLLTLLVGAPLGGPADSYAASIEFDWLGVGAPGAQNFNYYDDNFALVATLETLSPKLALLHEPSALWLAVLALGGVACSRRRREPGSACRPG